MNLSALILAAGKGSRFGKPKLMIEFKGKSFLSIIADNLLKAGIENIFCVVSSNTINPAKENVPVIKYIVNPEPENGMISSVRLGLKKIGDCDGIMIFPVDHPFVKVDTLKIIIDAFNKNSRCLVKPLFNNTSGHPVIIPQELSKQIINSDIERTLDVIIRESLIEKYTVNTNDSGVIRNINTREDLNLK